MFGELKNSFQFEPVNNNPGPKFKKIYILAEIIEFLIYLKIYFRNYLEKKFDQKIPAPKPNEISYEYLP